MPRAAAATALLAPGLAVFAAVPVLGAVGGGFATATWCLAAICGLALLVVAVAVAPPAAGSRTWHVALAAYGLFCAWSFLSILWADVPGDAWDGANRTLLYGLALVLVGLRPWPRGAALLALCVVAFGTGAVALGVLVVSAGGDVGALFVDGRLSAPTGYANATACLWLIAFWPALQLAAGTGRTLGWPLRALALATAALLLETALLSQSRGAAGGFAVAAVVYLWLAPARLRAGLGLGVVLVLAAASWSALSGIREAASTDAVAAALGPARGAIALSMLLAFAAGAAGVWLEGRLRTSGRRLPRAAAPAAVAALLAGIALLGQPLAWTAERWQDFKTSGYATVEQGGTRFTGSLGSNRYDFYRVGLEQFRAHPVLGIGADNFAVPYLAARRSPEAPRYPHSLALRVLAQLGVPGTLAFLAFVSCMLLCARRRAPACAGTVAAAVAGFVMWFAHGMVDWLWEFPALSIAAIGLLALASRTGEDEAATGRAPGRVRAGALAAAALLAGISFALPGAAARSVAAARDASALSPALGIADLRRAAALNPLSARPLVAQSILARQAGRLEQARAALRDAVHREPRNWFAHLELALLDAQQGRTPAALRGLRTATALNPRQPVLGEVRELLRRGRPVAAADVEARLAHQLASKLRPAASTQR
ncbi:MAG TPA: O-antigen ligase family protein [Solirubrobacteraceae bacterium]|nr:O-antigen ligase family protein [Solirubrobacteraceae bacterium]